MNANYQQTEIEQRIATLSRVEYLTETNEGTYGPAEAVRACGSGDPAIASYRVYETVGGTRRRIGCDPDRAPGYARHFRPEQMRADREELARMKREVRKDRGF